MIYRNKRDQEAWLREKTLESLKANIYLQENDIIQVAEDNNFYKVVKTTTSIPLQNYLYAQIIPSEIFGNISTATKLKTPRNISLAGDVTGNANFDGSEDITITAEIGNDSHTHSNDTIISIDAAKVNSGVLEVARIPNLDANKITSGTIDIDRLPKAALERCVIVQNDEERFALTKDQVQNGDAVKVITPDNIMYAVIDDTQLSSENGYIQYSAAVKWETIKDKPTEFNPKAHTHLKNEITDFPESIKNPHALTISLNGVSQGAYDGSKAKEFNITPDSIGAQPAGNYAELNHTHSANQVIQDETHRFVTDEEKKKWNHEHPYLSLNGGIVSGKIIAEDFVTSSNKSVSDHEDRIILLEEKSHDVNFINEDKELDNSFSESYYNKEEFNSLAKENDLFKISDMNELKNAIDNKQPIGTALSDSALNDILHYNDENDVIIQKNDYVIYNGKIKQLTNLSNVKDVFAASHASYVLTFDNKLYSWGHAGSGQLGDGSSSTDEKIHQVQIPEEPIKIVSANNGRNVFVVYENNDIWCWGSNNYGSLGLGHANKVDKPVKLNLKFNSPIKQIITKAHDNESSMSAILLENGELYVCGRNIYYALGFSHTSDSFTFLLNNYNFESKIKKIEINAVYNHNNLIVLTENGDIFTTGHKGDGFDLSGTTSSSGLPYFNKATILPKGEKVIDVFASANNLCITTDKNNVYYYGRNEDGSLGIGNSNTVYKEFITHPILKNKIPLSISGTSYRDGNGYYTGFSIVTKDYNCYISGNNLYYTNGFVNSTNLSTKINIDGKKIKKSIAGFDHRLFLTIDGEIYVLGRNDDKEILSPSTQVPNKLAYDFSNDKFSNETKYINYSDITEERLIDIY